MAFPAAAAISGGTGIAGSLIGGWFGQQGARDANDRNIAHAQREQRWNRENANTANQFNIDQWGRVNEYNNPTNQMQRLKDAGLNPRLIYGSTSGQAAGTANKAATAHDVKGYTRPESRNIYAGMSGALGNISNFAREIAQTNNIEAQTQDLNASASQKKAMTANILTEGGIKTSIEKYSDDQSKFNAQAQGAKVDQIKMDTAGKELQNVFNKDANQIKLKQETMRLSKMETESNTAKINQEIQKTKQTLTSMGVENSSSFVKYMVLHPESINELTQIAKENGVPAEAITIAVMLAGLVLRKKLRQPKFKKNTPPKVGNKTPETKKPYNSSGSIKPNTNFLNQK